MGYVNPLLKLPAGQALLALPAESRAALAAVCRDLRHQANGEAETAWKRRKGPMASYWRAVSTYARHVAHALGLHAQAPVSFDRALLDALQAGPPEMVGYGAIGAPAFREGWNAAMESVYREMAGRFGPVPARERAA